MSSAEHTPAQSRPAGEVSPAGPAVITATPSEGRGAAWRRTSLRIARFVVPALIGLGGAAFAMAAFGRETVAMGPFRVQLAAKFGRGITDISLPPLGRLTADTHRAPLRFSATLQNIDVSQLADQVKDQGVESIVSDVRVASLHQLAPFAIRVLLVAMAGALVLALVAFRTRWRSILVALSSAFVLVGGCEAVAWQTYRPSALLTPTFSGSLALAPKLIGPAQTALDRIDNFRAELDRVLGGAIRVYTSLQSNPVSGVDEIRVLHISDIHLSPLGMDFAKRLADAFHVDFVLDTGDLTSFGTPVEDLILNSIRTFGHPYVYVRGNHDSLALQEEIGAIHNAIVLDGRTRRLSGLTTYGLGDPLFTPNKLTLANDQELADAVRSVGPRLLADIEGLSAPPDIVAVHDERMAETAAGFVPLVVSGHFHQQSARVVNGTLFLRTGSTGGAGANVFTEQGGIPLDAEILYFERTTPPHLVAYDDIRQSPESGSLTVKRHLVEQEFGSLVPTPPTPSPSITPGETGSPPSSTVFTPSPS